jgi:3-oxoacyl-[acyl-carrier-protein] synthase-3
VKSPSGAAAARLLGIGEHRPRRVVANDDLDPRLDTTDEWVRTRTGITTRRFAGPDESVVSMAADAAGKALAAAGVTPAEVDLLLLATCTMPSPVPAGAPQVATLLGCGPIGATDINAACAGFCYALNLAADAVRAGSARYVVVAGSERLTDWIDPADRGTAILFGDGAAAVVVGPADEPGIGPVAWGSDGAQADLIAIAPGGKMAMAGQPVFRWASTALIPVARRACELAGVAPSELAAVVPHQANGRIIDAIVRGLDVPTAVVARDITETGNTSAASVPLALAQLVRAGQVRSGDLTLLLAFGAGLTYAGQVVRTP